MRPKPTHTSQSQTRYYFHGDLVEPSDRRAEAGDYYCDRCETFVRRDHFYRPSSPHSGDLENVAHYQQMAKNWHATSRQYRPTTSLNLFF